MAASFVQNVLPHTVAMPAHEMHCLRLTQNIFHLAVTCKEMPGTASCSIEKRFESQVLHSQKS